MSMDGTLVVSCVYNNETGPRWTDPVTSWLDITDEPAVSRAAVQAAVDEIEREIRVNSYGETDDNGMCYSEANDIIEKHTGVTPTEE